jgi:hypothetical protein
MILGMILKWRNRGANQRFLSSSHPTPEEGRGIITEDEAMVNDSI